MMDNVTSKWMGGLGAAVLGIALAGCGPNTGGETTTPSTATTSTAATTQTAKDDHSHAPGEAPHEHPEGATHAEGDHKGDHDAQSQVAMAKFFPGAELSPKPFPFNPAVATHMGQEAGVKFTGKEGQWQVFEATQDGKRVGLGMMTHSALPDGKDMHIAFGVNPKFAITHVTALDGPDNAKMQTLLKPLVGKTHAAAFKVGKDLQAPVGLSPLVAQTAADAVHKGVVILEENFNPSHGDHQQAIQGAAAHTEGDGHSHAGTGHAEGDGHAH